MSEKSETPNIDELLGLARRLVALLEDPHPGHSTWCSFLGDTLDDIVLFRQGGEVYKR